MLLTRSFGILGKNPRTDTIFQRQQSINRLYCPASFTAPDEVKQMTCRGKYKNALKVSVTWVLLRHWCYRNPSQHSDSGWGLVIHLRNVNKNMADKQSTVRLYTKPYKYSNTIKWIKCPFKQTLRGVSSLCQALMSIIGHVTKVLMLEVNVVAGKKFLKGKHLKLSKSQSSLTKAIIHTVWWDSSN